MSRHLNEQLIDAACKGHTVTIRKLVAAGAACVRGNAAGDPTIDPIAVALDDAAALEPNPSFRTIDEIRQHVATRRAAGP